MHFPPSAGILFGRLARALLASLLVFRGALGAAEPAGGTTTILLVRHAEKAVAPPENKDPVLSAAGQARAQLLSRMLGESGIAAIYASSLQRTQQTVRPLAEKLALPVAVVPVHDTPELVRQIRARDLGRVILVAGHNSTVPEIIAAFGGPKLPIIPESEYDRLYVLTIPQVGPVTLVLLRY